MKTTHLKVFTLGIALISSMGVWGSGKASETFKDIVLKKATLAKLISPPERERYIHTLTTPVEQPDGSVKEENTLAVTLPSCLQRIKKWDYSVCNPTRIVVPQDSQLQRIDHLAFHLPCNQTQITTGDIKLNTLDLSQCSPDVFDKDKVYLDYLPVPVHVVLPAKTKKLRESMFESSRLSSLQNINDVTEIGCWCFMNSSMPRDFRLPPQLTRIEQSAFHHAKFPNTSLEIPAAVTSLGHLAFAEAEGLTCICGGQGLTFICGSALSENKSLVSLIIDNHQRATIGYNVDATNGLLCSKCSNLKCLCFSGPVVFEKENQYMQQRFAFAAFEDCDDLCLIQITDITLNSLNVCDPDWFWMIDDDAFIFVSHT